MLVRVLGAREAGGYFGFVAALLPCIAQRAVGHAGAGVAHHFAGLAGAWFTIDFGTTFQTGMTNGRGFIALAAMIFGKWTPVGAYMSSLIFGFADSLQVKLQILRVPIPSEFLLMAPYIVTMIVLTGVVGRAIPPAADGQPYEK